MSLPPQIRQFWLTNGFQPPTTPLLFHQKTQQLFLVIDDSTTIFRLMDSLGNIFGMAKMRCAVNPDTQTYECDGPMYILTCRYNSRDRFALDTIAPIVFGGDIRS